MEFLAMKIWIPGLCDRQRLDRMFVRFSVRQMIGLIVFAKTDKDF